MVTYEADLPPPPRPPRKRHRVLLVVGGGLALLLTGVVALSLVDWNMLRGPVGRQASLMAGRPITITGNLKVHLLSLTPSATADDVHVGGSDGIPGDLARIGRFSVSLRLLPLLLGRIELPLVELDHPDIVAVRQASGRANWRSRQGPGAPPKLPVIQHLVIADGHFRLTDQPRQMVLTSDVQSSETQSAAGQKGVFTLQGKGSLNGKPFALAISGGPLLEVKRSKPYDFDADLVAGDTRIQARGVLPHPFDLSRVRMRLMISGADLADLYHLTGVAFPTTPRYRLTGDLVHSGRKYAFTGFDGRVGSSDLEGRFQVDNTPGRPTVNADLRSRSLALSDLGAVVGAPSKGPAPSPLQQAENAKLQAQDRLLPDVPIDLTRIRSTDATVRYVAASVSAGPSLPLRGFKLDLGLDHGVLTADPLAFDFPMGSLAGRLRIDARTSVPKAAVDFRLSKVRLEEFLPHSPTPPLTGILQARARLSGEGASVRQMAGTANGTVTAVAPGGQIRQSLGELIGVDVTKGLGLLLAKDQTQMSVRCAVADFRAENGVFTARNLLFDTQTVLATGSGTIDLKDETLDLTLKGQPKRFRLVRLQAPISLQGRLRNPRLGIKPGGAAAQVGTAVALGALLTPLAAILPFVDPGLAHDADCAAAEGDSKADANHGSATRHAKVY